MLTLHCSAASGMVAPPSIAPTTRLRRSSEYGFAIHAGLLPAGSLNHIRPAMGIPDSAFPGNALALETSIIVSFTLASSGSVSLNYRLSGNDGRARFDPGESAMPMRTALTIRAARDQALPFVFHPDFLAMCTFVA